MLLTLVLCIQSPEHSGYLLHNKSCSGNRLGLSIPEFRCKIKWLEELFVLPIASYILALSWHYQQTSNRTTHVGLLHIKVPNCKVHSQGKAEASASLASLLLYWISIYCFTIRNTKTFGGLSGSGHGELKGLRWAAMLVWLMWLALSTPFQANLRHIHIC